ncbi:hypothetical protein HKCCE4037_17800 [Rhodobacterales bacterium HKCCE4037]|nr:hypothetical protein [Rhodobacterales bacterium HKCCE4037]
MSLKPVFIGVLGAFVLLTHATSAQIVNRRGQVVHLPAGQLQDTVRSAGVDASSIISDPQAAHCTMVTRRGNDRTIMFDFLPLTVQNYITALAPPPLEPAPPIVCTWTILNYTLDDSWQLLELTDIDRDCSGPASVTITRPNAGNTNMMHQVRFEAPRAAFSGGCTLRIGTAVLFGPHGDVWNNGF